MYEIFLQHQQIMQTSQTHSLRARIENPRNPSKACRSSKSSFAKLIAFRRIPLEKALFEVASNKKLISQQSSVTISELFPYALDRP